MRTVDIRLFAKIKSLLQYLNQTQLDSNVGICTLLNQMVSEHCMLHSPSPPTKMVSDVVALTVTVIS